MIGLVQIIHPRNLSNHFNFIRNSLLMKFGLSTTALLFVTIISVAQKVTSYSIASPNGSIELKVETGVNVTWTASYQSQVIIAPSSIAMRLENGEMLGDHVQIISNKQEKFHHKFPALFYAWQYSRLTSGRKMHANWLLRCTVVQYLCNG